FEPCHGIEIDHTILFNEIENRILSLVDGKKDVMTIAQSSGFTEFETSKTIYGLYVVGFIQPADPDKSKLKRVFKEFAELMCRGALPYRITIEEAKACEKEVNDRCKHLPVCIQSGFIEDRTDTSLATGELASIYRTFLQTQHKVLTERLGRENANELRQQVMSKISSDLRDIIEKFALI
ncbi:MAG: hypothetical protein P1S60_12120, partial [Anaerolineae bacterium]|nr:hypothetical protein [Anaerolineae bacterium]